MTTAVRESDDSAATAITAVPTPPEAAPSLREVDGQGREDDQERGEGDRVLGRRLGPNVSAAKFDSRDVCAFLEEGKDSVEVRERRIAGPILDDREDREHDAAAG